MRCHHDWTSTIAAAADRQMDARMEIENDDDEDIAPIEAIAARFRRQMVPWGMDLWVWPRHGDMLQVVRIDPAPDEAEDFYMCLTVQRDSMEPHAMTIRSGKVPMGDSDAMARLAFQRYEEAGYSLFATLHPGGPGHRPRGWDWEGGASEGVTCTEPAA